MRPACAAAAALSAPVAVYGVYQMEPQYGGTAATARGSLSPLGAAASRVIGEGIDRTYGFFAGHGRGALHFATGGWGDLSLAMDSMRVVLGGKGRVIIEPPPAPSSQKL